MTPHAAPRRHCRPLRYAPRRPARVRRSSVVHRLARQTPRGTTADLPAEALSPRRSTADDVARFIVAVMLLGGALVKAVAAPDVLDLPTLVIAGMITVALAGGGSRVRRAARPPRHPARS